MNGTEGIAPAQPTRRQHATRAILLGGGIATLLSVIPVVSSGNMCFGLWIILGGGVSVWHLQKKVGNVPMGEAAAVGALSGLIVGLLTLTLTCFLGTAFGGFILAEGSHREKNEILPMIALLFVGMGATTIVIYPMLASFGGVITGLMVKPAPVATMGPGGVPMPGTLAAPSPEELAASAASRQKWTRILGCGCVSVLGFCAVLCGTGGYLFYLEEGVDLEDTAGTEEIVSVPLVPGQIAEFEIPPGNGSSTRNAIWLVGQGPLPPGLDVHGRYSCDDSSYGEPRMETLYTYPTYRAHPPPEWKYLTSHYGYSYRREPIRCRFDLTTTVPVIGARLVVTRLTRPSDWFD